MAKSFLTCERLCVYVNSGDTIDKVVWSGGGLQRDGDGAAGAQSSELPVCLGLIQLLPARGSWSRETLLLPGFPQTSPGTRQHLPLPVFTHPHTFAHTISLSLSLYLRLSLPASLPLAPCLLASLLLFSQIGRAHV